MMKPLTHASRGRFDLVRIRTHTKDDVYEFAELQNQFY